MNIILKLLKVSTIDGPVRRNVVTQEVNLLP